MYIAATSHIFREYIGLWLESVHDLYALQSTLIDRPFESFFTTNFPEVVNDSEEKKEYLEKRNTINGKENDVDTEINSECSYLHPKNR